MTNFTHNRRQFLQTTSTIAAAAAVGIVSVANADDSSAQIPIIYTAIKGGGIGRDKAAMVARLKQLKALGLRESKAAVPESRIHGPCEKRSKRSNSPCMAWSTWCTGKNVSRRQIPLREKSV